MLCNSHPETWWLTIDMTYFPHILWSAGDSLVWVGLAVVRGQLAAWLGLAGGGDLSWAPTVSSPPQAAFAPSSLGVLRNRRHKHFLSLCLPNIVIDAFANLSVMAKPRVRKYVDHTRVWYICNRNKSINVL